MSTMVWGDDENVFAALLDAFRKAASLGEAVMVMTVSKDDLSLILTGFFGYGIYLRR